MTIHRNSITDSTIRTLPKTREKHYLLAENRVGVTSLSTTLFTDPKQFFEGRDLDIKIPAGIVAGIILLRIVTAVINTLLLSPQMRRSFGTDPGVLGTIGSLIVGVLSAVIGPLIVWALFSGIFYGLSEVLGDDPTGEFTDVLVVTAYGFIPRLITVALAFVLTIVGFVLVGPLGQSPSLTSTVMLLAPVVGLVMTLLSAYIWGNGLAVARNITPKQGYICTLPVVLLGLLFTVISIIGGILGAGILAGAGF